MKLKDWIKKNKDYFTECDLRYLLKNTFLKDYIFLYLEDYRLSQEKLDYLEKIKKLYLKGYPLAYLLKKEDFLGLEFKINSSVFVPRQETEVIVEEAIQIIRKENLKKILDLGCGCGNIGICIKKRVPHIEIFFSDINLSALKITSLNLNIHNLKGVLINCDLFEGFKKNVFDLIISNPPYVEEKDIKGSLRFEPVNSLKAEKGGLFFIEKILKEAYFYLKEKGFLILECGYNHKEKIEKIIDGLSFWQIKKWIKDYLGKSRGLIVEKYG